MFQKGNKEKVLTREEILNADDQTVERVFISNWNGYVYVKSLSGKERDQFERDIVTWKGKGKNTKAEMKDNIRARLVALTVVDPDTKKPVFSTKDVEALGNKSAAALDTIYDAAQRLSKLSDEDVEELAEENFTQDREEGSTSSLPES